MSVNGPARSPTTQFYTVVYRVTGDAKQHDDWWQSIRPLFLEDDLPVSVISITKADLSAKVDELEAIIEQLGGHSR